MPDWSYRTALRPLMLAAGPERSRRLATATLRTLSRLPFGLKLIDFLGHMAPDARLLTRAGAMELRGPVSLGPLIDPRGDALPAFSRFGVGMIEVGPVAERGSDAVPDWRVDVEKRTISASKPMVAGIDDVLRNLERADPRVPVCVHLAENNAALIARLKPHASLFVLPDGVISDGSNAIGLWMRGDAAAVRAARQQLGDDAILIAAGASEPADVQELLEAGASLASIDAGLVCSGPGLVKRCNEALLASRTPAGEPEPLSLEAARSSWFWAFLMGVGMFFGGLLAVAIASTRVVLPYDESLCGLTRAQMAALNPRLLPFMAHDRVSLAGTMLSIGILYAALGWAGIRRGAHWAQVTVIVSATVGFLTFFTFLGFGYFDPFHAFVTAILSQFLLLCLVMKPSPAQAPVAEWRETAAWRRGQWGQLLFILLGVGLTGAGFVITVIGCTSVFVHTDLAFMRTTAAQLHLSYERLVPLVAHDRATLGGMLIANGITVWLSAQWGFRAGTAWLWHALAWGGNLAFALALGVHLVVGYSDPLHLTPAILGWTVWNVALAFTRQWLCAKERGTA